MTDDLNNPNQTHITASGDRSVAIGPGAQQVVAVTGDHVTIIQGEREAILAPDDLARLTAAYLQAVEDRWTRLEADEARPPLDSVFFMLQAREREERRPLEPPPADLPPDLERRAATDATPAQPPKPPPSPMLLGEVLKKEPRLVILGEPGAGKTTALQFVALCFARRKQEEREAWHRERLGIEHPWIPVLLTLQTRADTIAARDALFDVLAGEVRSFLPSCSEGEARALLRSWLAGDGLLVLLDGLDEVIHLQGEVREKIARLRGENIRVIVTSRPAGFAALGDLKEYTLKPLDKREARGYLTAWLKALTGCSEAEAGKQAEGLLEKMRAQSALRRLTDTPLLLRLSAEYYARTGDIVRNRAELYRAWIEEAWRRAEKRGADTRQKETALAALAALAWHRQVGGDNTEEALCEALQKHQVAAGQAEAESLLALLRTKVGLLALDTERKEGRDIRRYLFAHQTVHEYFVARRLQRAWQQDAKRTFRFLKPRLHLPEWGEPLLLLAAKLPKEEAGRLVQWVLCAHSPFERRLKRDLLLAAAIAANTGHLPAVLFSALLQAMRDEEQQVRWAAAQALRKIGPPTVPALLQALRDESTRVAQAMVEALGEIGDPEAVPALLEMLRHESTWMRHAAVKALGEIGDPQAAPALLEMLRNRDEYIRREAAKALGKIGDPRAAPALLEMLRNRDEYVRWEAAKALNQIGPPAVSALLEALRDKDANVRQAAVEGMVKIGPQAVPALCKVLRDESEWVRQAAEQALGKIGPPTVPALLEALWDKDENVRRVAAELLAKIGDPQAVLALCKALRDEEWGVRQAAAGALGKISDSRAAPALIEALRDEEWQVRREAAKALGEIGDPQATPALIEVLRDEEWQVCWEAAESLAKIGDPEAVPVLLEAWQNEWWFKSEAAMQALAKFGPPAVPALLEALRDYHWMVRQAAVKALGEIGPPAMAALLETLQDEDEIVRQMAAEALAKIGDPQAVPALCKALRDKERRVRRAAAGALAKIGNPQAAPALREALQDKDEYVRREAVGALARIGPEAVPALLEALQNERWLVRQAAVWALKKTGDPQAAPAVVEALRDAVQDEAGYVRREAVWELAKIGGKQAVLALCKALRDNWWEVRQAAAGALGEIGDPQAAPALLEVLRDEFTSVRQEAAEALVRIGAPQTVAGLIEALQDEDNEVRRTAAEALGKIGDAQATSALINAVKDRDRDVHKAAAQALTRLLAIPNWLSAETAAYLPELARSAARMKDYDSLAIVVQVQAAWRVRQSPWQDPLQPPPFQARFQQVVPVLAWLALAGVLALLGILVASAGDALKTRLLPLLQSRPLALVVGVFLVLAALAAGLKSLQERWSKRSQR